MTVKELIGCLEAFPPGALILRDDNSGGYEAVRRLRKEDDIQELGKTRRVTAVIVG